MHFNNVHKIFPVFKTTKICEKELKLKFVQNLSRNAFANEEHKYY